MLSNCAVIGAASKTGEVKIKYDSATRLCEINIEYNGNKYRQAFIDESDVMEYHQNLWISIPRKPFVENTTKYYGYFIFGGCAKEILNEDTNGSCGDQRAYKACERK